MAKPTKKKKMVIQSNHPAVQMVNYVSLLTKMLLPDNNMGVYELYESLHNQKKRSPYTYLPAMEIKEYLEGRVKERSFFDGHTPYDTSYAISIALGWKQTQQVYRFDPRLIEELDSLDISDDKYFTLTKEEIEFLPCFNFFVEFPMELNQQHYDGFFVFFDKILQDDVENQMHISFIGFDGIPKMAGTPMAVSNFNLTLVYEYDFVKIQAEDTGEELDLSVTPQQLLHFRNPRVFEQLGEEKALQLLLLLTQMVSYLCASNADKILVQKPKKKKDLKRTRITDFEMEKWDVGTTIYYGEEIGKNLLNTVDGAYERVEPLTISDVEAEAAEDTSKELSGSYRHEVGYHVRPHTRKAHWAYYWYGKKDGSEERVRRRKFIQSVRINNTGKDILIPTRETVK